MLYLFIYPKMIPLFIPNAKIHLLTPITVVKFKKVINEADVTQQRSLAIIALKLNSFTLSLPQRCQFATDFNGSNVLCS